MKQTLSFLFIAATLGIGCKNITTTTTTTTTTTDSTIVTPPVDTRHDLVVLDSTLKQYETPMQHLKASLHVPTKVVGAKGTTIDINADDLETVSGKPMGNHIDIDLKELTTKEELAREGISTESAGKIYLSAGVYYINLTTGGEQLRLKQGKTLDVSLCTNTEKKSAVFYMPKDSLGKVSWKVEGQAIEQMETLVEPRVMEDDNTPKVAEKKAPSKNYVYISLRNFGWITCDYNTQDNQSTTSLTMDIDRADTVNWVSAYLVFKDANSTEQTYFETSKEPCAFRNVPLGAKAALIIIGLKNGRFFTATSKIVLTADRKIPIKLKETPAADVANLFKLN